RDEVNEVIDAAVARLADDAESLRADSDHQGRAEHLAQTNKKIVNLFVLKDLINESQGQLHEAVAVAMDAADLKLNGRPTEGGWLVEALPAYLSAAGLTSRAFGNVRTIPQWRADRFAAVVEALAEARNAVGLHPEQARRTLAVATQRCDEELQPALQLP